MIEELKEGCRNVGYECNGEIELYDIDGANDLMYDAAVRIEKLERTLLMIRNDGRHSGDVTLRQVIDEALAP